MCSHMIDIIMMAGITVRLIPYREKFPTLTNYKSVIKFPRYLGLSPEKYRPKFFPFVIKLLKVFSELAPT